MELVSYVNMFAEGQEVMAKHMNKNVFSWKKKSVYWMYCLKSIHISIRQSLYNGLKVL
jgi:hypothetical protein